MNRYMLEEFHSDPALRRRLFGDARRERMRAVRAALAALLGGFNWLVAHLKPRRPVHWIERLG